MLFALTLLLVASDPPAAEALGWTHDGAFFAYGMCFDHAFDSEPMCDGYFAVDARSGDVVEMDKGKYAAWLKTHPLVDNTASGPNTGGKAELVLSAPNGTWDHSMWTLPSGKQPATTCSIHRGAEKLACHFTAASGGSVSWSPDETRLAWVHSIMPCMRDASGIPCAPTADVVIDRTIGPAIDVVSLKLSDAAVDKTYVALEKAGFAPTASSAAKAERDKSVVYVAKGFDDAGKKIAAAIPGGATVEALTWKTPYDVVVALGKSVQ